MPIMNGYDATDKIRKFIRINQLVQPMIVACTGHTEEEYIQKAWNFQIDEVIQKPINIDVLKELFLEIIQ